MKYLLLQLCFVRNPSHLPLYLQFLVECFLSPLGRGAAWSLVTQLLFSALDKDPNMFWSPLYSLVTICCSPSQFPDREEDQLLTHHASEKPLPPQEEKLPTGETFCDGETLLAQGPGAHHQAPTVQAASYQDASLHQGR